MTKNPTTNESDLVNVLEPANWEQAGFTERVRAASAAYVKTGMAFPLPVYLYYVVRMALFVGGWMLFCRTTPGLGTFSNFTTWIFEPIAFQKAFLWAGLCESMGLLCMSGPLGLRIWPPFTASLHWLRPGTTKLASFPGAPVIGGHVRTLLDVALYAAFLLSIVWALVQPAPGAIHFALPLVFLAGCALVDRNIALCAREEHHFAMVVCFLLAGTSWMAGAKWVQLSIWFWAGVSKLTVAFAYVVPIMTANNPLMKSQRFRRKLFVDYPEDLHPSTLAKGMAHAGTFLEFATPIVLLCAALVGDQGWILWTGLFFMVCLHGFIISNMPIAAVFEWNVLSLYAGTVLFLGYPDVSMFDVPWLLAIFLLVNSFLLPLYGNLVPSKVSFLVAMRYYAGNWAWNAWLFHDGAEKKLDKLRRAAPLLCEQQRRFLPVDEAVRNDAGFLAFRTMHLQGRVLGMCLPQATEGKPFHEYTYADGETVSASIVGWNFGEGHSSDERLVDAVQKQVGFEPGECRVVCVEAQPILGSTLHWRVVDAATGQIAEGHAELSDLAKRKPWDVGPL